MKTANTVDVIKENIIQSYQKQINEWSKRNFKDSTYIDEFLGITEEVGELAHAILKQKQGIRIDENHEEKIKDAVGDIFIYLCDFCNRKRLDLNEILDKVVPHVLSRDWTKDKTGNGK